MSNYRLINARILSPGAVNAPYDGEVIIEDGVIAYAGDARQAPIAPEGAKIIDMGGRIVMPGLVNAHTHAAMTLFRGAADDMPLHRWLNERIWPLEERLDEIDVYRGSLLAAAEMIAGGVCAFNDMYFHTLQTIRAVEQVRMRATLPLAMTCPSADAGVIAQKLGAAVALYERFHGAAQGRIRVTLAPHAEYTCSPEFLKACAAEAKRLGAAMHIHVSETLEEHEACKARHGVTPVALLHSLGVLEVPVMMAHCVYVEDEDLRIMADNGVIALHCPESNLKLGSGIADVGAMLSAGVCVALGTDGAASNNNLNMFEEMHLAALLHKGAKRNAALVDASQAFEMATLNGAKALMTGGGRVEAGYRADLVALDVRRPHMTPMTSALNNVVYSAQASDVWMNMVDGEVLYYGGSYKTMEIDEVMDEATRCAARLVD